MAVPESPGKLTTGTALSHGQQQLKLYLLNILMASQNSNLQPGSLAERPLVKNALKWHH